MKMKFYREEDNRWYAYIPDFITSGFGDKDDLEMVGGADNWLDILAQGDNEVYLTISENEFEGAEVLEMVENDSPETGATYKIGSYRGIDYSHLTLWLCPVTLYVFGKYPEKIYYK